MARSIVLSNGQLCVALDKNGEVRDIYYPHVGLEDHVRGHYIHRVGVWIDGEISWLSDPEWKITVGSEVDSLASIITAVHERLEVTVLLQDLVHNEIDVFFRQVTVTNTSIKRRTIKFYFGHQFEIYKSHGSDTAYFDPFTHTIIHYKGHRVFLIAALLDGEPFQDYATGRSNFQGKEGTHRDADDGALSKNPIEHGPADSVIGLYAEYESKESHNILYSMTAAQSIKDAQALYGYVTKKTPAYLMRISNDFWKAWVATYTQNFSGLEKEHVELFKRSLLIMRAHVDIDGGVIASCDSDMLQYGLDTYSYVWPRDAAYIVTALCEVGDFNVAKRFFDFCKDVITDEGYFMHKYSPDKSLGSSWHPWVVDGQPQLPIQEDETAIVVYAIREYYRHSKDLEFLESMFATLVEKPADFMVRYRDAETKLPKPSYDLWERKRGASTYTAASVYGALLAAAELSKTLGKLTHETHYTEAANEIKEGILKYLWDEKNGQFYNMLNNSDGTKVYDSTVDISSVYGVFLFGVLPHDDPKLERAFENAIATLGRGLNGGVARFEHDDYYQVDSNTPGNPWILTTLWYAEYVTARATKKKDLEQVIEILSWVTAHAQPSGVLSEQINPHTGEQVCATPLTWSHAAYVSAVLKYRARSEMLGVRKK